MRAFRIAEPDVTEIHPISEPVRGPEDVLLRVRLVGFCGSDLSTYRGANPLVSYPRIPGHEIAATIEAVGGGVPGEWQPGMAVTLSPYANCGKCTACRQERPNCCRDNQTLGVQRDGAMTELIAAPWQKLFPSVTLSLRELALVEPLTVGAHAVDRGCVAESDTVCVLGCGAIGLGAIAGAAFRGARVVAVDIDEAKLALARRAGASETVNTQTDNLHEQLQALTDGEGPEVIVEAIGLPQTFRAAVDEVCFAGRIVYIGYAKAPVEYETKYFVQKELDLRGSRNALPGDFLRVIGMLEAGGFPVAEAISQVVPLEEAGQALRTWSENPPAVTKILVDCCG